MSILIKGVEMPSGCENCKLKYRHQGFTVTDYCWLEKKIIDPWTFGRSMNGERPEWCPLVELPPHGRLIDADALSDDLITKTVHIEAAGSLLRMVRAAPTIIEAEDNDGQTT